jgi:hypothetical protein
MIFFYLLTSRTAIRRNNISDTGMSKFVLDVINTTIGKNRHAIKLLDYMLGWCEDFFIALDDATYHENSLARGKVLNTKRMSKKQKENTLRLAAREGQSVDIIFDIMDELGTALRDLIIGDYRGYPDR